MFRYLIWLIFIISIALAAGSVLLSSRLRTMFKSVIFSTLLYFEVFIFTFGFYGIWGQVLIRTYLSPYISHEIMMIFSDIALLLGLPFLVFAWLMLIQFSFEISGRKSNHWFIFWFLFLNISILIIVGYFLTKTYEIKSVSLIRNYYIIMNLVYTLLASLLIYFPLKGHTAINNSDRRVIAPVLFLVMAGQCTLLLLFSSSPYIGILFIFLFFAGNTFLPLYLKYGTNLSSSTVEPVRDLSFEEFCRRYEISPRETDIIREVYNGLSNQEISDKLFISLQTVKDHTHRIYTKTNVKSRVQLITLVKDVIGK